MKNGILRIALVGCITFGFAACNQDETEDLNVEIVDPSSDPDEIEPGCDSPNGC